MGVLKRRGQSLTEYAVTFGVVAAAVLGMQLLVKRGLQARELDATDLMTGVTGAVGGVTMKSTKQYEPYYVQNNFTVNQAQDADQKVNAGYTVDKTAITETTKRSGNTTSGVDLSADDNWQ